MGAPLDIPDSLIAAASSGDRRAMEDLLSRVEPLVYRLALALTHGDEELARDIAQESMVSMVRGLPGFRGGASIETWIFRIVKNRAVDSFRKERVRASASLDENAPGLPGLSPSPEEQAGQQELRAVIHRALAGLPEEQREVIVLFDLEGWTFKEISDALGLPVGTIKSRWSRARRKLKEILEKRGCLSRKGSAQGSRTKGGEP